METLHKCWLNSSQFQCKRRIYIRDTVQCCTTMITALCFRNQCLANMQSGVKHMPCDHSKHALNLYVNTSKILTFGILSVITFSLLRTFLLLIFFRWSSSTPLCISSFSYTFNILLQLVMSWFHEFSDQQKNSMMKTLLVMYTFSIVLSNFCTNLITNKSLPVKTIHCAILCKNVFSDLQTVSHLLYKCLISCCPLFSCFNSSLPF